MTRHIIEETRRNSDDLAVMKTRMVRVEETVDTLERKVDGLERKADGLVRDLPTIVGDTMREVLAERDGPG